MAVSCGRPSRKSASDEPVVVGESRVLSEQAGEGEGSGRVGAAQKVAMDAAIVAAVAHVVLAMKSSSMSRRAIWFAAVRSWAAVR